ncbi:MAG: YsnF/AvaK domain-containing protein [Acidobacteria bacterium]|nr:YsnF/AvaK domain-containing protein [Acidobacteriota bacterium]MCA1637670.1 YsnF/AvaK domain-containing protein [Acidobacteriota bacterium]
MFGVIKKEMTKIRDEKSDAIVQPLKTQDDSNQTVIPVIQEELTVDKYVRETGKVNISKQVKEYEKLVDIPLMQEKVVVERVPINQFVEAAPEVRHEGDTMIISVVEEQAFVQKRLMLVEELHVTKQVFETHQPQRVTLRKEEVDIKRSAEDENFSR